MVDVLALDTALQGLAKMDELRARVVELRFFGGWVVLYRIAPHDRGGWYPIARVIDRGGWYPIGTPIAVSIASCNSMTASF